MHSVHSILRVRLITGDEDSDGDDTGGDNDDDDDDDDINYYILQCLLCHG